MRLLSQVGTPGTPGKVDPKQLEGEFRSEKKSSGDIVEEKLPGGFVSAIAGTSSARTTASPLETLSYQYITKQFVGII